MVTLGKSGTLHDRRLAVARLHQEDAVRNPLQRDRARRKRSAAAVTPASSSMNQRQGDAAQKAILEWVDLGSVPEAPADEKPAAEPKPTEEKEATAAATK